MSINNDIDTEILYTDPLTQKTRPAWLVEAVDRLLYKVRHKDIWEIVEFAVNFWARKNPVEHRKFLEANKRYRDSRKKDTGATDSNSLRATVNIPRDISYILEKIAAHKIKEYKGGSLKFWRDFARRYPGFAAAEKI